MDQSLSLKILEHEFIFDCRRAIYWPEYKVMLTADLHWGKTQYLRDHGIAISDKVFEADLLRLSHLLRDYEVKTLLVLGDLIHHEKALSQGVVHKVAHFRLEHPCELILVKGNHDRYTHFPPSWGIVEEKEFLFKNFLFAHELKKKTKAHFQFTGHIHPMMRLRAGMDMVRLPSFIVSEKACLLPAFSHLTSGQDMKLLKGEKAVVVMEDGLEVFEKN